MTVNRGAIKVYRFPAVEHLMVKDWLRPKDKLTGHLLFELRLTFHPRFHMPCCLPGWANFSGRKTTHPIADGAIIDTLKCAMRNGSLPCVRERAHAVLLSSKGYSLAQIADVFDVQYQTISRWIDGWEFSRISR